MRISTTLTVSVGRRSKLTTDVLDSFNAPPKSNLGKHAQESDTPSSAISTGPIGAAPAAPAPGGEGGDDEFEASLIEGMESLLRSLANEHPPGPMADSKAGPSAAPGGAKEPAPMSSEEEERAFQKAVEMMLSGEGMDALGMGKGKGASKDAAKSASTSGTPKAPVSFEETIRKTMESIDQGGAKGAGGGDDDDIAALLKKLSENPGALDMLGDGDDDELGGLLDGMMAQLMSKEVLEEPMNELAAKVSLTRGQAHGSTLDTWRSRLLVLPRQTWKSIASNTSLCSRFWKRSSGPDTLTRWMARRSPSLLARCRTWEVRLMRLWESFPTDL